VRTTALIFGCGLGGAILWLWLGSRFVLMFDQCFPGPRSPIEHDHFGITLNTFSIDMGRTLTGLGTIKLSLDSQKRVVLGVDDRSFTLGPMTKCWSDPYFLFVPEADDVVSFTRHVSRIEWHTPFAFYILGGTTPKRHRYGYERLRWTKNSGAALEITWRTGENFYPRSGWAQDYNYRLTRLDIRPGPTENAAAAYLAKTKNWTDADYRLESQACTKDDYLVAAIFLKDETASYPGGGKSVLLRINKNSKKVVGETGFQ
jgi:hypothetical protein